MSKPDLNRLFLSLPERSQAQGFVEHTKNLLAAGETLKARQFFNALYAVEGYDYSKASVGQYLIDGYVDRGECDAALKIYTLLEKLNTGDEILTIRTNCLLSLVDCLLPSQMHTAIHLWEMIEKDDPPVESLWALSNIGTAMLKIAISNDDIAVRQRVYKYLYPENENL